MKVVESFTCGKAGDAALNEDAFIVTDDFLAVLDGVTAKRCPPIDGKSGGRFAAETGLAAIASLSPTATAREAIDHLTSVLARAVAEKLDLSPQAEHPAFAVAIYSRHRKEVWRVADPAVVVDGVLHDARIPLDDITSAARAFMIEAALQKGATLEAIAADDVGRAFIAPMLQEQHLFANRAGPYGFGDINGDYVPDDLIDIIDVSSAREIILATDGYPAVLPSLAASEENLASLLKEDPLLFRRYKSTKGLQPGYVSFDDRTYVRFLAG